MASVEKSLVRDWHQWKNQTCSFSLMQTNIHATDRVLKKACVLDKVKFCCEWEKVGEYRQASLICWFMMQ